MGIFSRLKTLISSNVNDLISKAENPEKMLNQLLIEMNEQLIEAKRAVALAIADEKKLERETLNHQEQVRAWEQKAILAVKAQKDDLAKEALIRKQEYEKTCLEYKKQWDGQRASTGQLKEALRELQSKIEDAQRKKNLLIARAKRAEAQEKIQNTISSISGNRSAFNAFERISQKVDQMEARAEASKELEDLSADSSLEKRFAELEKSGSSADLLLAELKEKMKALPETGGSAGSP
ncbi:MAG: PspA/IM30 family protein [Spirochaetaceae bacterium]|jgi:phage shock protein A|nr:PspA/IM30 family protein [Spirochaetaceae bacterium]